MSNADLEQAGSAFRFIRALIMLHPGGGEDREALARLRTLLAAAHRSSDEESTRRIRDIERYAHALFSASEHRDWARGPVSGADVLRLQILREIDALAFRGTSPADAPAR